MKEQLKQEITLRDNDGFHRVLIKDIIRIEGHSNYATFFIYASSVKFQKADDKGNPELRILLPHSRIQAICVRMTMKECLEEVTGHNFMQVHQSHIINRDMLECYD